MKNTKTNFLKRQSFLAIIMIMVIGLIVLPLVGCPDESGSSSSSSSGGGNDGEPPDLPGINVHLENAAGIRINTLEVKKGVESVELKIEVKDVDSQGAYWSKAVTWTFVEDVAETGEGEGASEGNGASDIHTSDIVSVVEKKGNDNPVENASGSEDSEQPPPPPPAEVIVSLKITAIKDGTTKIRVTSVFDKERSAECTITVPNVTISMSNTLTVIKGGTGKLTPNIENTGNKKVTWSTSDSSVADVDTVTGTITGKQTGTAIITATTEDEGKTATCTVTVPVVTINFDKTSLYLFYDGTGTSEIVTLTVSNIFDKDVQWSWSDGSVDIAGFSANGDKVTFTARNKAGKATYTATTSDGEKKAEINIAVSAGFESSVKKIKMMQIPAGTFMMGKGKYDDGWANEMIPIPTNSSGQQLPQADWPEEMRHSVTLTKDFYIGKYEVTQEEYEGVMTGAELVVPNPSSFKNAMPGEEGTPGKLPVESINWYLALVFCNRLSVAEGLTPAYKVYNTTDTDVWIKLGTNIDIEGGVIQPNTDYSLWTPIEIVPDSTGYRLPTEAEWEYACRAGTTTRYNTGDTMTLNTGWYFENSWKQEGNNRKFYTHKVGLKPPNAWGLHDMHGNVYEWCWDWKSAAYPLTPESDPRGPASGTSRVLRGGSFNIFVKNDGVTLDESSLLRLTSTYRGPNNDPKDKISEFGFRVVRPVDKN